MFTVPLKCNLNCTDSFQTRSFTSRFEKYTLDYWLLTLPDPSLISLCTTLICQKHPLKTCSLKEQVSLAGPGIPLVTNSCPDTGYRGALQEAASTRSVAPAARGKHEPGPPSPGQDQAKRSGNHPESPRKAGMAFTRGLLRAHRLRRCLPEHLYM